jgi:hypothetical protein
MPDDRLTKKVFLYDYGKCNTCENWSSNIKKIFSDLNLEQHFTDLTTVSLSTARDKIRDMYCNKWQTDLQSCRKLRTYKLFKDTFDKEDYISLNLRKHERSLLCQFRFGILPIRIETGRFVGEAVEDRICRFCERNEVEDETHFLLSCDIYRHIRNDIFVNIDCVQDMNITISEKVRVLMTDHIRKTAKYIMKAYLFRRSILYS